MMKLFLASLAINDTQALDLARLAGKPPSELKLALIENAADVDPEPSAWLLENRAAIQSRGFGVEIEDFAVRVATDKLDVPAIAE
jgi:hypothetical protein